MRKALILAGAFATIATPALAVDPRRSPFWRRRCVPTSRPRTTALDPPWPCKWLEPRQHPPCYTLAPAEGPPRLGPGGAAVLDDSTLPVTVAPFSAARRG